ncbi:hypothetical protein GOBAR_AA07956 [Gossypium barbadense]|uniref:1,3-beta-glucan synthase n=1 Tax=Gossypium barbadense TaxID=3634 RepID=A0A2P5YAQ9_GOSBA|nr:hypothetical protein GOBAR_AA07956 [Gossypium barbadense]
MASVLKNWERLVRATLEREQLRDAGQGHARRPSGIAGAVHLPPSLGRATNIDAILQAADEIQAEDPHVARILCEQAYGMAQNLDPNSEGRGVLQFKTGLMSVIKQKLAKRDGGRIDRNRDIEHLWEFYKLYKRRHKVDDIQREEQRWRESGTFSSTSLGDALGMKKVLATLRALVEVMEALSKDADPDGVGRLIKDELRRIKNADATLSGELTPYNIVPLEAPSFTNAIGLFPEVRGAISAIRYTEHFPKLPSSFSISGQRDPDMFDLLEYVFGFQKDNVRNQRENVVLTIANAQSRLGIPVEADPKIDEKAINEVFLKVLDNYIKWCRYLRIRLVWNSLEAINKDRKLFLVSLYFLIWGEAANVRFLPECICYIFHHMARELDSIVDHGEANPARSCTTESGSVSFLEQIICPIYNTMAEEAARNNNGKAAHSSWRNYDDFNEYFWSPACFELSWPMRRESPFLLLPKKGKRTGKSTFVEHRTFLHLYRSFHRLWIFLVVMFQALAIIAFRKGRLNLNTFKILLSIGPTFAIMNFIENNNNILTIVSLWAPVIAIYLMDIHIWYTLLSAIIGGVMGARARLGEIRSTEMVHKRFESFPEVFANNLVSQQTKRMPFDRQTPEVSQENNKTYAALFSPFWNEIIKSLREEDYISNREMDLLLIPSNRGSLRLVQWPLFLLSSKILLAVDLAIDCKDTQADLWNRICKDEYMAYAVQECYYSIEKILHSLVDGEGRLWVERIYREINNSISEGSLVITLSLKKLPVVLQKLTALLGLLRNEKPEEKGAANAVYQLYEVVTHDLLSPDLREQLDTWNILARARNEGRLFSRIEWPKDPEIREQVKRLYLLLTVKDSAANIPKNLEARRRLEFFTNSLFMDMPPAKPVCEMMPFCVFTPYYSETVLYSPKELREENEDGISTIFYLQKIFPEWENYLERINEGKSTGNVEAQRSNNDLELRFWASYRGQTLARTVRGMMYYRRALMLQSFLERRSLGVDAYSQSDYLTTEGFELSREARAQADIKFTYVVSCQIYGQQKQNKKPEAVDIALLLQRNEALRVAFIHAEEVGADGKRQFYSKLVKADINGKDQEVYSIKLPGDPKLGEGKPENQNHAIIFTRGEAIQTIDMNQDNYLEEAMKMRNLLEEFRENHGIRPPTILGVREHVFTGSVSSLAWFMSNQETSFVTLGQRVLANPLKVRMHYGHPDVFDRIFHITRGGISKASRVINISEDIYAGFNSTLRRGNITHHEYIQVGKGRDVGLNQIALFEGKVAGGNGEQVLSRDAFSGLDEEIARQARMSGNTALDAALNTQFLVQIGVFTAVPMIMGFILELGLLKAVFSFITMQLQLCSVFFTFSLGTRTHYFGRTILHGGAKYRATGRGFVVRHIKFAENYRLYSRSHFVKALEVALLLIVYIAYGYTDGGAVSFVLLTLSSWFLVISWLFAPYIFNPSGFEWQKTVEDFDDWTSWLLYKGGVGVKGDDSWESWWDEEQLLTYSPKKSHDLQLVMRFMQGVISIGLVVALCLIVAFTGLSIADLFASILGFVPTGWAILCLAVTWKRVVRSLGLWDSVREIARFYDAGMGTIIFAPLAVLSWFPFISTFQSRLLFNQAFSRGLEISLILAGNKANVET